MKNFFFFFFYKGEACMWSEYIDGKSIYRKLVLLYLERKLMFILKNALVNYIEKEK